ncbi:MAG: hypothetical protein ACOX6T_06150 [Myxococcales bacterium]|jgi:hypothetical protein
MTKLSRLLLASGLLVSTPTFAADAQTTPETQAVNPHAGHNHAVQETEEERAKIAAANTLTEAKMKSLAVFVREETRGTPFTQALKKAKLKAADIDQLAFLPQRYYRARLAARAAEKELAEIGARIAAAAAKNEQPAREDVTRESVLKRSLAEHERFRRRFLDKVNEKNRELIAKFEDEFVAILQEADKANEKREAEAKAAAVNGFTEERLSQFLLLLQESAKGAPYPTALEKSKLDRQVAKGLSLLVAEFYNKKLIAEDDQKKLEEARTRLAAARQAKKPAPFEERLETYYLDKLKGYEAYRAEFTKKNGKLFVELLDKRSAEFLDVYKKSNAALQQAVAEE